MIKKLQKKKISELTDCFNNIRKPLSSVQRKELKKIYPYYGAQGIVDYVDKYLFDGEYLLVAEDGENLRTSNQNICNLINRKFWVNNHAHILKANRENITKYLYYNFNRINFVPFITGSAQPKLNKENLLNIETPVHNYKDQQKIASVLSALDDKIELNNKINAELEAMAKILYDYWFVQFDFPNPSTSSGQVGKPYKSSGGEMVYNEVLKREVPEGWEVKTLGDYCKSKGGFAFKSTWWVDDASPVVKIKDIQENNTLDLSNLSCVSEAHAKVARAYIANPGNIVIAMTGATVGKFAIVPFTSKQLLVNQRVGLFNLGENPISRIAFLINSMRQDYFREKIFSLASGAAQPNISNDQINGITLLMPTKEIIHAYNKHLSSAYTKILNNQKQNQELASLRDLLLPMLMNGQVRVQDDYTRVEGELGMVVEGDEYYNKIAK